jgi:hypothetical protein
MSHLTTTYNYLDVRTVHFVQFLFILTNIIHLLAWTIKYIQQFIQHPPDKG